MRRRNILFIVVLVLLVLIYIYSEANRVRPVDWTESFSREDKIPYGAYIAYHSLPCLFPGAVVETVRKPLFEQLQADRKDTVSYISIGPHFAPDETEINMLFDFVEQGNNLFIAAEYCSNELLSQLNLEWKTEYSDTLVSHSFIYSEDTVYYFRTNKYNYLELKDDFAGKILGRVGKEQRPDFVMIERGQGRIYLNLNPLAFTNYFVLDGRNGEYYSRVLSCLPAGRNIVWDDYPTLGSARHSSPFRVILGETALRQALYLLTWGILLYLFFCSRREQRPIPQIRPPQNKTLEFIGAVSSLFYKQKDHKAIATRRIRVFLEDVRHRYKITTEVLDARFVHILSLRSGVDEGMVAYLAGKIVAIEKTEDVSEEQLKQMVKLMELFK